jgi:hypothetical protein
MIFAKSQRGVDKEYADALIDTQAIGYEYGDKVILYPRGEVNVTRDKYSSIKKGETVDPFDSVEIWANPVRFSPTDKELLKAGIREKTDVLLTIAMKELFDNSLTYEDIDTVRSEVDIQGTVFVIRQKNQMAQYGSGFLYITLGCFRR